MPRVKAVEIPQLMRDISAYSGDMVTRLELQLMALRFHELQGRVGYMRSFGKNGGGVGGFSVKYVESALRALRAAKIAKES